MNKYRKIAGWVLAAACVLFLLLPAGACLDIYLDGGGFSRESISLRFAALWPAMAACFLVGTAAFFASKKGDKASVQNYAGQGMYRRSRKEKPAAAIPVVLLGLAGVFILLGVINGGARDVLVKAVNICTECIGLG